MEEQQIKFKSKGDKLFIGGDLSGIQKFIYNISSKRAAVSLKGRSLYLEKYTRDVFEKIMDLPELTNCVEVYCSSGKFYIIADNSAEARGAVDDLYRREQELLWKKQNGQLGLNISYKDFSFNDDGTISIDDKPCAKIGELWKSVTEDFMRLKALKFKDVIDSFYDSFFEVTPVDAKSTICAITGIESSECVPVEPDPECRDDNTLFVLPSVREQINLGIAQRNNEGFFKTFEQYAENSHLGVLRMDVDGLGKRFISGFNNLNEYKQFSLRLQQYFEINIKNIQKKEEYRENMCIIYAGGDDIFAVGKWDKVIDFADEVRKDFAKYIDDRSISLSGGVAIVNAKFPIAKAAELSGEAEARAKEFKITVDGREYAKNAFCMFNEAISWEYEFGYVRTYKDKFYELIKYQGMSRSILHKIMLYSMTVKANNDNHSKGKAEDYSYIWHASYFLTRMQERYKSKDVICEFVKDIRDRQLSGDKRKYILLAVAARWAELELRETK